MNNTLSIVPAEGTTNEFPVLKAFQQYINEEQNKARKRVIGLCVFFTILMMLIVGVFLTMMFQLSARNQQLNDRLVDFAMRERAAPGVQQPVIVQQPTPASVPSAETEAVKTMTETIAALQKQLLEQQSANRVNIENKAQEAISPAEQEYIDEETAKLKKIKAKMEKERARMEAERKKIAAERKKIADEKERQRQEEIEQHRRRLYPEYYAKLDAEKATAENSATDNAASTKPPYQEQAEASKNRQKQLSQQDIDDLLREVDAILGQEDGGESDEDLDIPAINYFDADENDESASAKDESAPSEAKDGGWRIPLD